MASLNDFFLDFFLFLYTVAGSASFGYIFLRIGWPKIRVLHKSYKKGWSIIFGVSFFTVIALISAFFGFFSFFGIGFREFLFLFISTSFLIAVTALSVWRKFLKKNPVSVSVPGTYLQAKIAAAKAQNQLSLDPAIVIVNTHHDFLKDLKKTKQKRKMQRLNSLVISKNASKQALAKKLLAKKIVAKNFSKLITKKNALTVKSNNFSGLEIKDLFGEQKNFSTPKKILQKQEIMAKKDVQEDESDITDLEEIKKIGQKIQLMEKEQTKSSSSQTPLEKLLKQKKKKIKFIKNNG